MALSGIAASSSPLSSVLLDGAGPGVPDYSPYPVSSDGLPLGLDPVLQAGYVIFLLVFLIFLIFLVFLAGFLFISYSLISFLSWYCLLSRVERHQDEGGPSSFNFDSNFAKFLESFGNSIVEATPVKDDFEGRLRVRRMTGPELAALDKKAKGEAFEQLVQGHKMAASSVDPLGFQVRFSASIHKVISFLSE